MLLRVCTHFLQRRKISCASYRALLFVEHLHYCVELLLHILHLHS